MQDSQEAVVKPQPVEIELDLRRFKLAAHPENLISRPEQSAHLLNHFSVKPDQVISVGSEFALGHGLVEVLSFDCGWLEHPDFSVRDFDSQFVKLGHIAVTTFHPKHGTKRVVQLHQVRLVRDGIVVHIALNFETVAMKEDVAQNFEYDVSRTFVFTLAEDQLAREITFAILAGHFKNEFPGHRLVKVTAKNNFRIAEVNDGSDEAAGLARSHSTILESIFGNHSRSLPE
jgi:hypothetical protein